MKKLLRAMGFTLLIMVGIFVLFGGLFTLVYEATHGHPWVVMISACVALFAITTLMVYEDLD
jgi:hypothetical protein